MTTLAHQTVLLEKAVTELMSVSVESQGLAGGVYVDGTFGRGGHSVYILDHLFDDGRLIAFDKDIEAAQVAEQVAANDVRFTFIHSSFANLEQAGSGLAGVLLDLGVSSPQLDARERGFSFQHDGPLDMRMDTRGGKTAADFVNMAAECDIARVLKLYGEERFAKRIAAAIVRERELQPFETTGRLATVVAEANPAWDKRRHPATKAFQAIRIHVNRELDDLKTLLYKVIDQLIIGGRLVVISFHSLEDRMVKNFMRDESRGKMIPRNIPIRDEDRGQRLKLVGKAIRASKEEVAENPRARSAIMRVAERVA